MAAEWQEMPRLGVDSPPPTVGERFVQAWQENFDQRQSLGSTLAALGREAIKDVRGAMNEAFFGQAEHASEPGTPLNPTPQIITEEMQGKDAASVYGKQRDFSPEM